MRHGSEGRLIVVVMDVLVGFGAMVLHLVLVCLGFLVLLRARV